MTASPISFLEVAEALETMHGQRHWHWWPDADPFEVCVGAILVQNTMWSNVERALARLRDANVLTPSALTAIDLPDLEELIRPSGQFRQKALKLRAFLELIGRSGSLEALLSLPAEKLREQLLQTFGIGPETADCILLYAARQPAVIADAYLARLFTRVGIVAAGVHTYTRWQAWVNSEIECAGPLLVASRGSRRDFQARFHAEVVLHCKHLCTKRAPKCGECLLLPRCPGSPDHAAAVGG